MLLKNIKFNTRTVACVLAMLFIASLVFFTIHSRTYYIRRQPWVNLTMVMEQDLHFIALDAIGHAQAAHDTDDIFDWHVVVTSYEEGREMVPPFVLGARVYVTTAGGSMIPSHGEMLRIDGIAGDIRYTIGFMEGTHPVIEGEEVRVFREVTMYGQLTLPLHAVHFCMFANSHYVYTVSRRDRAWGREFVAERQDIQLSFIGRFGAVYVIGSAITNPVVAGSNIPISHGVTVRLFD